MLQQAVPLSSHGLVGGSAGKALPECGGKFPRRRKRERDAVGMQNAPAAVSALPPLSSPSRETVAMLKARQAASF